MGYRMIAMMCKLTACGMECFCVCLAQDHSGDLTCPVALPVFAVSWLHIMLFHPCRFVFIMGTSIALAFRTLINRNVPRKFIALKVIKRTVILFFLGLMISNFDKGRKWTILYLRRWWVLSLMTITSALSCGWSHFTLLKWQFKSFLFVL